MKAIRRQSGFSLTEVLLAIGTMAIGMLFVGGVFMLGVHQTTVASEKTIASVAASEAFGKIQAYGLAAMDPNDPNVGLYNHTPYTLADANEHYYAAQDPAASAGLGGLVESRRSQYSWTALTRPVSGGATEATVFVLRHQEDDFLTVKPVTYEELKVMGMDGGYVLLDAPVDVPDFPDRPPVRGVLRVQRISVEDPQDPQTPPIVFKPPLPPSLLTDTIFWMVPASGGRDPVIDVYRMVVQAGTAP